MTKEELQKWKNEIINYDDTVPRNLLTDKNHSCYIVTKLYILNFIDEVIKLIEEKAK